LQRLFPKEVTFAQSPNEFLLERILRPNSHLYLSLRDDEESVTTSALANDVITLLVIAFLKNVGDLDERIFGKIFEDGNAVGRLNKNCTISGQGVRK
jgi:hypothetical protein